MRLDRRKFVVPAPYPLRGQASAGIYAFSPVIVREGGLPMLLKKKGAWILDRVEDDKKSREAIDRHYLTAPPMFCRAVRNSAT